MRPRLDLILPCLFAGLIFAFFLPASAATIDYSAGFSGSGMTLNGSAAYSGSQLQLTSVFRSDAASAFYSTPVNVQAFNTDFTLQLNRALADGMTFVIQNGSPSALGASGAALGYGADSSVLGSQGIGNSVALKFDIYDNDGEGINSTGLYVNGASPTLPSVTIPTVNLRSGNPLSVHLEYDGTTLTMNLKDTVTGAVFNQSWTIDIPATVGGNTAYVGFTAATGGGTATQSVFSWSMIAGSVQPPPPPPPPAAVSISVSPASSTIVTGGTQQFTATVTGTSDTTVVWSVASGGGSISPDGLYTAPGAAGRVTITARSLADPTQSATATLSVSSGATCSTGSSNWIATALGNSETGTFGVSFDATPQAAIIDANVALSQDVPAAYKDLAVIVRFNPWGTIDVRYGNTYGADYSQPYSAQSTYHFDLVVNVPAHTYSLSVTPPGGTPKALANNYPFRSEQANATSLNYWNSYQDPSSVAAVQVCNFSVAATPDSAIAVSISPASVTLTSGGTQQFTAAVTGSTNTGATWSAGAGSISSTGMYTAPTTIGSYTVVATSVADPRASALANVTVTAAPMALLSASPTSVSFGSLLLGLIVTKTVTLTNPGNAAVTIFSASTTGAGFTLPNLGFPITLAPGASQAVTISYVPLLGGTATGSVSFVSSATNSPTVVALDGSGTAPQPHTVTLNWQASTSTVAGHNIYRASTSGGAYTLINATPNPGISFVDTAVQAGQTYYYTVTAVSSSGQESGYSNQVTAVIPTP